ncbi:hypothetical protein SRDD_24690 [Serratia sp. DD3]|nr:hypothetical protein SRDD_24690 [Serratia sp. DD3]
MAGIQRPGARPTEGVVQGAQYPIGIGAKQQVAATGDGDYTIAQLWGLGHRQGAAAHQIKHAIKIAVIGGQGHLGPTADTDGGINHPGECISHILRHATEIQHRTVGGQIHRGAGGPQIIGVSHG